MSRALFVSLFVAIYFVLSVSTSAAEPAAAEETLTVDCAILDFFFSDTPPAVRELGGEFRKGSGASGYFQLGVSPWRRLHSFSNALGVAPDDRILAIDNVAVSIETTAFTIVERLVSNSEVSLSIERTIRSLQPTSRALRDSLSIKLVLKGALSECSFVNLPKARRMEIYDEVEKQQEQYLKLTEEQIALTRGRGQQRFIPPKTKVARNPQAADGSLSMSLNKARVDRELENLPSLLTQARAVPYFRDGIAIGMRLFAVARGSLYEEAGFKNGDILLSVNGQSLADPTQALKIVESFTKGKSTVEIERGGKTLLLSIQLSEK